MTDTITAAVAAATKTATATVTLDEPIQRGEQTISTVTLRKPLVRDLRGISLAEVLHMKTDAMAAVLPRISTPTILAHEVDTLCPADLIGLASEVVLFFESKAEKKARAALTE